MSNSRDHEWELAHKNELGCWCTYNVYRCVRCGKERRVDISAGIEVASCPLCKGIHFLSKECPDAECPGDDDLGEGITGGEW